jgi:hypothetical protein
MNTKSTREILFEAAEVLRTKGWTRNVSQNAAGECCVLGAISLACSGDALKVVPPGPDLALRRALTDLGLGTSIVAWNDSRYRTADQVITVLEYAASVEV